MNKLMAGLAALVVLAGAQLPAAETARKHSTVELVNLSSYSTRDLWQELNRRFNSCHSSRVEYDDRFTSSTVERLRAGSAAGSRAPANTTSAASPAMSFFIDKPPRQGSGREPPG